MGHEASLICHIIRCMQVSTRCTMGNVSFSVPWSTYVAAENEATCRVALHPLCMQAPAAIKRQLGIHQSSHLHFFLLSVSRDCVWKASKQSALGIMHAVDIRYYAHQDALLFQRKHRVFGSKSGFGSKFTEFTEFTEATKVHSNDDSISRHRFAPLTTYYLT